MAKRWTWVSGTVIAATLLGFGALRLACDPANGKPSMTLYGQVLDQNGRPVPDAEVNFDASRLDIGMPFYSGNEHHRSVRAITDASGRFTLNAGRGDLLSCVSLVKPGYSQALVGGPFKFAGLTAVPVYRPDPDHPVQFVMWNDAFRHVLTEKVTASVDGQLHTLAYRDLRVKSELGGADFSFTITKPGAASAAPFGWQLTVRGVGCDLQECSGQLRSEAPEKGYVPELSVTMSADDPHWSKRATLRFYTRSDHGEVYAGVEMHVSVGDDGKKSDVTITYSANFGNSRDLVPGPVGASTKK